MGRRSQSEQGTVSRGCCGEWLRGRARERGGEAGSSPSEREECWDGEADQRTRKVERKGVVLPWGLERRAGNGSWCPVGWSHSPAVCWLVGGLSGQPVSDLCWKAGEWVEGEEVSE